MSFSWNWEIESINVYTDDACTVEWSHTLDLGTYTSETVSTHDFYVKNEGTIAVDVTITGESLTGATVVWTPATLTDLAVGSHGLMSVEITVTGAGGYSFDFTATAT